MARIISTPQNINVRDLIRDAGSCRSFEKTFPSTEVLGAGIVSVTSGTLITIHGTLESLSEGVLASIAVETSANGECVRCLDDVTISVQVEFRELFAYSVQEAVDSEVVNDHIDLEPHIRDAVVLSLPFQPVCRDDCLGLNPETGIKVAGVSDVHARENFDPRWSVLTKLDTETKDFGQARSSDSEKERM